MDLQAGPGIAASAEIAETQSPRHQVYSQVSWNLPRQIELDGITRVVGSLQGSVPAVSRYVAVDERVAWQLRKSVELAVVGQNLTGSPHAEFGTGALLRSLLVEIERSVY